MLSNLTLQTEYRTGTSDPIADLFIPCLSQSILYKRAVGYFRSSVYIVAGPAIIDFVQRGGKIRLVCSPELDANDLETIRIGYLEREEVTTERLINEINQLLADSATNHPTRVLATLLAVGALEIKIAFRLQSQGIYHEKIGVFIDDANNRVSFIGSANESRSGWHSQGNFESIEVFCNWQSIGDEERSKRHEANFDNLWDGNTQEITTLPFPDAVFDCLCKEAFKTLDEAKNNIIANTIDQISKRTPLPHQISAIEAWHKQDCRGVFEHATGSGKTFTALEAARSHLEKGLPVLILVPSSLLLKQWHLEVKIEFPETITMLAGDGNNEWQRPQRLNRFSMQNPTEDARVIIATMQTAATDNFRQCLRQGEHLMLIADEVHQIGSPHNSQCLQINTGHRLGLSATPQRYGDPEGTAKIFAYFGSVVPPPITLSDAVKSGRLVKYEYHPHTIRLTEEEAKDWKKKTRQIGIEIQKQNTSDGRIKLSDDIKMLLIQRSRIAKKASAKPGLAAKILKEYYKEGQSWLIYCEDSEQLSETMLQLKLIGINPAEYHTSMEGDKEATLVWFRRFGGVLVSINCLDEGVDIPTVTHALILASSQNPRQFIQRRGRVLRKADNKYLAYIHDAIVVPISIDDEPEQLSLLKSELLRAIEFSNSAINKSASAELRQIAFEIGFDPDESTNDGIEEDN